MNKIKDEIKLKRFRRKWRKINSHNYTYVANIFPIEKVSVGDFTYGCLNVRTFGSINENLKIGNCVSIAEDVLFCLGGEHPYDKLSTFPFEKILLNKDEATSKGPIVVEDDVWIGLRSTILSGVKIGKGAVIAAGSVIYKDVPPYAIVTSNGVIKYRFSEEIRDKLCLIDYSKLKAEDVINNLQIFKIKISENYFELYSKQIMEIFENNQWKDLIKHE